jgi:DNA polymerase
MGADQHIDWRDTAASALEWWADAGVDTLVEDDPRDWFAVPAPPPSPLAVAAQAAAAANAPPEKLEEFLAWRGSDIAPEAGWNVPLLPIVAVKNPRLMILTDLPEEGDSAEAGWMTGEIGALLDRMLAAIGLSRGDVVIAGVAVARPLAGRVPVAAAPALDTLAQELVSRVAPHHVLLFGADPCRAILGQDGRRGGLQHLNHDGIACPAIATFHPRFLLERPGTKAEAWRHLQLLIRETDS